MEIRWTKSAVKMTWTGPDGTEASATVETLDEAASEQRRLERLGCESIRVLTDPMLLTAPTTRSAPREHGATRADGTRVTLRLARAL